MYVHTCIRSDYGMTLNCMVMLFFTKFKPVHWTNDIYCSLHLKACSDYKPNSNWFQTELCLPVGLEWVHIAPQASKAKLKKVSPTNILLIYFNQVQTTSGSRLRLNHFDSIPVECLHEYMCVPKTWVYILPTSLRNFTLYVCLYIQAQYVYIHTHIIMLT